MRYEETKKYQKLTNFQDDVVFWYTRPYVLYNLRDVLVNREVVFINKEGIIIRPLGITSTQGITYFFDKYHFFDKGFDIYASVATLNNVPETSVSNEDLREVRAELRTNWDKYVKEYDFFIDIDCEKFDDAAKNFQQSKKWAIKLMNHYKKQKFKYHKKFSGNKGFHFTIPASEMKIKQSEYKSFAEDIAKKLKIPFEKGYGIDNTTFDKRRICKAAYSLSSKTHLVALPVTDKQLKEYEKEDYSVQKVIKNHKLFQRGLFPND